MKYTLLSLTSLLLLASCHPYHMDIPQGKTLSSQQVAQVHLGMSKEAVRHDLGEPIQDLSPYDKNRFDYVYTMQKNGGTINEKRLSVYFNKNVVSEIKRNDYVITP